MIYIAILVRNIPAVSTNVIGSERATPSTPTRAMIASSYRGPAFVHEIEASMIGVAARPPPVPIIALGHPGTHNS